MVINGITNLLVWAHILSPSSGPEIPAREDVAVEVHHHHHKESRPAQEIQNHHYHKESKPVQGIQKPNGVVAPKKNQGPMVFVSHRLRTSVQQVYKAFPQYAWSKENRDLIARIARSSQERYEDLYAVIQECLKCVTAQKTEKEYREIYGNFEQCKQDLRQARGITLFLKAHKIKSKR